MTLIKVLTFMSPEYEKGRKRREKLKKMAEDFPNSNISVILMLAFIVFIHSC